MKYVKYSILTLVLIMLGIWATGKMSISEDERKRIKETQFKAYPLSEPIGIKPEPQEFTFRIKSHRTSSRYAIKLDSPRIGRDDRKRVLYPSAKEAFSKDFSLVVEDAKNGRVIFRHTEKIVFRHQNVNDYEMSWSIAASELKFRRSGEYLVHVTMPGIEDAPDELSEIYLRCYIPFRPSL